MGRHSETPISCSGDPIPTVPPWLQPIGQTDGAGNPASSRRIYPEGASHNSGLIFDLKGIVCRRPELSRYQRVDKRGAIHEAGEAVVAWALGRSISEIHFQAGGWILCGMMIEEEIGHVWRNDPLAHHLEDGVDIDYVIEECAIAYAGSVAEARYAHVALPYCMNHRGDADRIRTWLGKGRCRTYEKEHRDALAMARRLTAKYQGLILAITEILLARCSIAKEEFFEILDKLGYSREGDPEEEDRRLANEWAKYDEYERAMDALVSQSPQWDQYP